MARSMLELIQQYADSITVTVVVHPDDEERVQTALENLPPEARGFRLVTSSAMEPGKLVTWVGTLMPDTAVTAASLEGVQD